MYTSKIKIKGYHGTPEDNVESIKANNFRETIHDKWMGNGVYFFVDGISSHEPPVVAFMHTNDNVISDSELICENIVVLEATISINGDKYLDLTVDKGLKALNNFKNSLLDKLHNEGKKIKSGYMHEIDALRIMRQQIGIEFVKANVYIRVGIQKTNEVQARLPNVTIFVVNNPTANISRYSITEVLKKEVQK